MQALTPRQAQILAFIREYQQETGYPPTRSEIAQQMGFRSPNAAEEHLKALARKKAIEIVPGASRGIRLPDQDDQDKQQGLPVIGQVAAGSPILAQECIDEYVSVPAAMFNPSADYLLTVKGTSMINVGIFEGDLLAVHKTNRARHGEIIVARLDDEVTVKRLEETPDRYRIRLLPENDDYQPIEVDLRRDAFAIEGISVGVIRRHG
ncbi:transcriptional repressor LexA [Pseudohongiella spirulinae]|uniref:LexA repressor n=1 Tax=Pseudohongiella spirulinae TaxID=1249552 RepID=A0A0S2KEU1_9GAMM|nr:transcriptional repressor LexA [Pseudohongiella spirulinae]ALO46479.1 LexA repressor [Pseudohongiella spirulinae]